MLIADGGGSAPYRLHPPVPSPVPKPQPTPRPPSLDAGPRPTLKTPQVDPRILRAEGISRAQLLQQQAAAHQKDAVAEQQRAQQARQRADESQQQARVAEARSSKTGTKEDKTLADQWRKQANDDELNALRCEADANFTSKQATLEKSKLLDMQEGHASEPSRETQAAQVEANAAASTVSLLYDTPPGEADPLKAAGQTTHQLAKAEKWGEWQGAAQQEIRLAGLRALAKGEDPQAAMRERAKTIEQRDVDGLSFTVPGGKGRSSTVTGEDLVQEQRDIVLAEDPSQAALNAEFQVAQKARQPLIDAAEKKAAQADDQVKADKKALTDAPGGLKRDYMDSVNTSKQAAAGAGENLNWWESRFQVADNGYQQRQADLNVHHTEVGYQVAVVTGDPKSSKDQTAIADAKDARDRALGDQVLVQDQGKSLAAGVTVLDDKADLKDAWNTYYDQSASQVQPRTVTYKNGKGTEYTQTLYPEGYDKTFWAVPGSEEGKNVHRGDDGKYYYVSTTRGGSSGKKVETDWQELNPAAAGVWAAHDKLNGRKDHGPVQEGSLARQKQADSDYAATNELLGSNGQVPGKLDPVYWERRAGEIKGDLSSAKDGVTDAQRAMANAQTYGGSNVDDDPLVAAVGDKVRIRDQAQLQADALHAVQQWRASPGDKKLLDAAGKAVAKAGNPQAVSKDTAADLRADRDNALQEKKGLKKTADQPGDGQQAALDKISRLDLKIEHDNNLIAQVEAGNQRTGALYLNSQFSFGDTAKTDTEGDVRFAQLEDADGYPSGMDAAPPLNYEDLMSKATMDGDDKVLGDSGIRIRHETQGYKDVWEVPVGGGMKQYIYQRDGQVFMTRTLVEPGQRLSAQTEELWQRLWKADAKVEATGKAAADSTTKVGNWNQLNPGDPILAPGEKAAAGQAPAQPTAPPGLDGKPVKVPTLWDGDLDKRRDDLLAQQRALHGSMAPGEQMPEVTGMLQAELGAVIAMKDAQDAHRALQQWKSSQGPNATEASGKGKELRQAVSDAEDAAIDKKDKWLAKCRSHGLDAAKEQRSTAQARHQQWKDSHPALVGTEAERSTGTWAAWQQAEDTVGGLQQQHIQAATPAAWAAQKALIDDHLPVGQRQDTGKLHELFMANPEVMAQPLINEHYLEYGGGPLRLEGRTHLNNEVSSALGFTPDSPLDPSTPESNEQGRRHSDLYSGLSGSQKKSRDAVADEIAGIGGDQAKVTLLPVVYSTPQSGVVKTTLFKVEDGQGGAKFVDERGARYKDLDDYRANNALPSTDCNIVMPASDKLELDSLGNVKLRVLDARTETGWETFKRRSHFDTIVGGASVVLGVVMTVGSGGMLAPVAAGLLVAASAYGATTSIISLNNRASHGLSVNPFTDREARLDWLNLAGSVLAVPTLSAATRAGMVAWQATRAAKAAGAIETGMPWLAIRGSKETGKLLSAAARGDGPGAAQAAAMQNKINAWNAPARVMAKPTMVVGGLGLEENTRYMADNWESMSSDQRWEQGGMTLLNLVDFAAPVLVKGVQAGRQGARGPAGSEPAAPVPAPVPDAAPQTFGSLPDAPLPAAAGVGPYKVGAAQKSKLGAPVTNADGQEVAYIRPGEPGPRFVDKDGADLPPHRVDELQQGGPLRPEGTPAKKPSPARETTVTLNADGPSVHVQVSGRGIVFKAGAGKDAPELSPGEIAAWMEGGFSQGADTLAQVLESTAGMQVGKGKAKGMAVLDLPPEVRAMLAQSVLPGKATKAAQAAAAAPHAVAFASGQQPRFGLVAPLTRHATGSPTPMGGYIPRRAGTGHGSDGPPRLWEAEHAFFEAAGRALHAHARQQGVSPAQLEGSIRVYVDRSVCDSCLSVSAQFQRDFPGIRVRVRSTELDALALPAALAARDSYHRSLLNPQGSRGLADWTRAADADVQRMTGHDPAELARKGLGLRVYLPDAELAGRGFKPMVVFRGSEVGRAAVPNWRDNLLHGLGRQTRYDRIAADIGTQLKGQDALLVGHSLGGRLAAVAAHTSGLDAITFNAAGVNRNVLAGLPDAQGRILSYRLGGDPLSLLQRYTPLPSAPGEVRTLPGPRRGVLTVNHLMRPVVDSMRRATPSGRQIDADLRQQTRLQADDPLMRKLLRGLDRANTDEARAAAGLIRSGDLQVNVFKRDPLGVKRDGFYVDQADYIGITVPRAWLARPQRVAGIVTHEAVHYMNRDAPDPHSLDLEVQAMRAQGAVDPRHWSNRVTDDAALGEKLAGEPAPGGDSVSSRSSPLGRARTARAAVAGVNLAALATGAGVAAAPLTTAGLDALPFAGASVVSLVAAGSLMRSFIKSARFAHASHWNKQHRLLTGRLDGKIRFEQLANELAQAGGKQRAAQGQALTPGQLRRGFKDAAEALSKTVPGEKESRPAYQKRVTRGIDELAQAAEALGMDPAVVRQKADELKGLAKQKASFDVALRSHVGFVKEKVEKFPNLAAPEDKIKFEKELAKVQNAEELLRGGVKPGKPGNDRKAREKLAKAVEDFNEVAKLLRPGSSALRKGVDLLYGLTYGAGLGAFAHKLMEGEIPGGTTGTVLIGMLAGANALDLVRIGGLRFDEWTRGRGGAAEAGRAPVDDSWLFKKGLPAGDDGLSALAGLGLAVLAFKSGVSPDAARDIGRMVGTSTYAAASGLQFAEGLLRRRYADPSDAQRPMYLNSRVLAGVGAAALVATSLIVGLIAEEPQDQPPAPPVAPPSGQPHGLPSGHPTTRLRDNTPVERIVTADGDQVDTAGSLWAIARSNLDWILTPQQQALMEGPVATQHEATQRLSQFNGFDPRLMDGRITAAPGDPDLLLDGWKVNVNTLGLTRPPTS